MVISSLAPLPLTFTCLWRPPLLRSLVITSALASIIGSMHEEAGHLGVLGSSSAVDLEKNPDFQDGQWFRFLPSLSVSFFCGCHSTLGTAVACCF